MLLSHRPKRLIAHAFVALLALGLLLTQPAAQAEEFSEFDLLLLDFTLGRDTLAQSVTAYAYKNTIVVSLAEASAALEFPISVDANEGTAEGWFISKDRRFELDIGSATVTIEGEKQTLSPTDAIAYEYAIYVPLDTFSRWFPVDLSADIPTMSIKIEAREQLPTQLRAQRRQFAGQRFILAAPSLPRIKAPYRLIGPHSADLSFGYSIQRDPNISKTQTNLTHSSLIRGDLAFMTSSIYLSGNDSDSLTNARITLSRRPPYTPAGINLIEIGDITPLAIRGTPQNNLEQGLLIRGAAFGGSDPYDLNGNRTQISGDVLEGWEIELLQNGIRIDYQIIGPEGRYDFRDLELYSGSNIFELIFYGPAGEQYSKTITRYSGAQSIRKNSLSYQLSASNKGKKVYDSEQDLVQVAGMTDIGTDRYTAKLDYGLLSNLSVGAGLNSVVENSERLNYASLSFRTGWRSLYMSLSATNDPLGGTIWDGSVDIPANIRFLGFNAQLNHTRYATSVLETDASSDLRIESRSSIVLTGTPEGISTRFSASHSNLNQSTTTIYSLDLSQKIKGTRIGNTLNYQDYSTNSLPGTLTGNLYFSSKYAPLTLRGNIDYQIQPESEPLFYQLRTDLRIASDMGMAFSFDHTPTNKLSRMTASLNWRLKYVNLSPRLTYDSEERFSGFIFAALSLSPKPDRLGILVSGNPMANNGGVVSRVFLDNDNNGQFSNRDTPLANVDIYAPQAFRHSETNADGTAYLTGLSPNKATDIRLDHNSLPGIDMDATQPGNSVQLRPAQWVTIDFPVVTTGEVDGTLYQLRDNKQLPLPGVMIELRNARNEVSDFRISGHDGFFLFDRVPYGRYTLTLNKKYQNKLLQPAPKFQLKKYNPNQLGITLVVSALKTKKTTSGFAKGAPLRVSPIQKSKTIQPTIKQPNPAEIKNTLAPSIANPYALQLGAYKEKIRAESAIHQLLQRHANLLQNLQLLATRSDLGSRGVFFRIRASGNLSEAQAKTLCRQLKQRGQSCIAVPE